MSNMKVLFCGHCRKQFRHMSQLIQHSLVHSNDRNLFCGICKMPFRDQYGLDQHSKFHHVSKPYVCDQCGKRFRLQMSLNQHVSSTGHNQASFWKPTSMYTSFDLEYNPKQEKDHTEECKSPQMDKQEPVVASSSNSDAQSTEMTSVDSLQIIDSFMQKEPIDSDEESLHLLLEADDDPPKNSSMETEDDILNKFEGDMTGTEAGSMDDKGEDHLLNEDHDNAAKTNNEQQSAAVTKELKDDLKDSEVNADNLKLTEKETEHLKESEIEIEKDNVQNDICDENKENCEHLVNGDVEEKLSKEVDLKLLETVDNCTTSEDLDLETEKNDEVEKEKAESGTLNDLIDEEDKNNLDDNEDENEAENESVQTKKFKEDEAKLEIDDVQNDRDNLENGESHEKSSDDHDQEENVEEASDSDHDRDEEIDNKMEESDSHAAITSVEKQTEEELKSDLKNTEESKVATEDETKAETEKSTENVQNDELDDKCDNSNDSSKCNNLASEDLLDICIIRDTEDDDASAIAEIQADAKEAQEKADNEDQESGSDRNDAEDDMEMDKDTDQMEIDDGEMHLEADLDTEKEDSSENSTITKESINLENTELNATADKQIIEDNLKETESINKADNDLDSETELSVSSKRPIDDEDNSPSAKKLKLDDASEEILQLAQKEVIKSLKQFSSFMKEKKFSDRLTRSDLEQFVMQKICEVIMHKTTSGDAHLTIKKHEQTIDSLRKDVVQLSKQCRDLEIVNKKLLNELKAQSTVGNKPLVPLKITRSVGLQVKLGVHIDNKRRLLTALPSSLSKTGVVQITSPQKSPRSSPNMAKQTSPVKQPITVKTTSLTTNAAPLLTQALQTKKTSSPVAAKRVAPSAATAPVRALKTNNAANSVIDLTAEDDKMGKAATPIGSTFKTISLNSVKTIPLKTTGIKPGTTLPAGIRVTPGKNGSITLPAGVMTSTPLMYVVQQPGLSQGIVTTTAGSGQKVFLNLQPTNGVLTSSLNGSAVSVFQKPANSTPPLKRKHPAALPPSANPFNPSDRHRKPVPPKPHLTIRKTDNGIILQWKMPYNLDLFEPIASYQLYAYQETPSPPSTEMWRRVGDVKALALPMACTLTQFADKNRYYFAVRPLDIHKRMGPFSDPEEISL